MYILYGTDTLSRQAKDFFGKEKILEFFDPLSLTDEIDSIPVIHDEKVFGDHAKLSRVVLTWNDVHEIVQAVELMCRLGIKYSLFGDAAARLIEKEATVYNSLNMREEFAYNVDRKKFYARDRVAQAGSVNHYFWQDLWAAQHIFKNKPIVHYDIGSRVDGFIAEILSFGQRVNLIDVRPLDIDIPNLFFTQADAKCLDGIENESIESLSALCSLEHFGLGRYGDDIDPEACFKCFDAIQNKVEVGGRIYIAVPVGREGVEFNAHRVFSPKTIINEFSRCTLKEYAVDFGTHIEYDVDYDALDDAKDYEFGLFYFVKER